MWSAKLILQPDAASGNIFEVAAVCALPTKRAAVILVKLLHQELLDKGWRIHSLKVWKEVI